MLSQVCTGWVQPAPVDEEVTWSAFFWELCCPEVKDTVQGGTFQSQGFEAIIHQFI